MKIGDTVTYRDADDQPHTGTIGDILRYISNGRRRTQYWIDTNSEGGEWFGEDEVGELDDPGVWPRPPSDFDMGDPRFYDEPPTPRNFDYESEECGPMRHGSDR